MRSHRKTFCRICNACCAMDVEIRHNQVVNVRGDRDDPITRGYTCMRGLLNGERLQGPGRILRPIQRNESEWTSITSTAALDQIAERLAAIVEQHGPRSVGVFIGTQGWLASTTTGPAAIAFARALDTPSLFGTMTIDQSAKWIAQGRIGTYNGGYQLFEESDVWMLVGSNPLVSNAGGPGLSGFSTTNPVKSLKDAKQRGLKLIVIDPRATETAAHADLFLQPRPGEDAALLAGILHIILEQEWHDAKFCETFVDGVQRLRSALSPFTPDRIAQRTGLRELDIVEAARIFACQSRRGMVGTGTGPDMGPNSNIAEHLAQCINAVCGRYAAVGDPVRNPGVLQPFAGRFADVTGPTRSWEDGPKSRRLALGRVNGEMMTSELASEMLMPGEGRIRALICVGSNPAVALPDQSSALAGLRSLDLLVTLDPRMSATAGLADFVIPPLLSFERHDCTFFLESQFQSPYAHYASPVVDVPPGSDLLEEWEFFWELSRRLELPFELGGFTNPTCERPSTEQLLAGLTSGSRVPLDTVRSHAGGAIFPPSVEEVVQPGRSGMNDRLVLAPDDVLLEIAQIPLGPLSVEDDIYLLTVRRLREFNNSTLTDTETVLRRVPENPAYLHPDDLAELQLSAGDRVRIASDAGEIECIARADPSLRRKVVSVAHCWGKADAQGLPQATSRLVSSERQIQTINGMPQMTAIPVTIRPFDVSTETS